jgi:hypothetical protein
MYEKRPGRFVAAFSLLAGALPVLFLGAAPAAAQACYVNCPTTTTTAKPAVTIVITPTSGTVGTNVTVTSCFNIPNHTVQVLFANLNVLQGQAGSDGCASGTFGVPSVIPNGTTLGSVQLVSAVRSAHAAALPGASVIPGVYTVTATSDEGSASTQFTVVAETSTTTTNTGILPRTGFQLMMWIIVAAALVVLGRIVVQFARRRRQTH